MTAVLNGENKPAPLNQKLNTGYFEKSNTYASSIYKSEYAQSSIDPRD